MQTEEQRAGLLARFEPEKLYQANRNFNAAQELDVTLQEGDLVAVIKLQDPMGSQSRWLVDNGVMKGFVYSSFLKPYSPRRSQSDISVGSHSSNESGYGGSSPIISQQNSSSQQPAPSPSPSPAQRPQGNSNSTPNPSEPGPTADTRAPSPQRRNLPEAPASPPRRPAPGEPYVRSNVSDSLVTYCTMPARRCSPSEPSLPHRAQGAGKTRGLRRAASQEDYLESDGRDPKQQVYYALYDFRARCYNELSLRSQQRVHILRFHDSNGNREWWLAEASGRRGYVPANYIRKTEYT
eukprot:gi/632990075/ref/XP_007883988.1/ PREDICTED: dynamin-binding protein-like [Callorhinchus milii]